MSKEQKKKSEEWEERFNRDEQRNQRRAIIATVVVVLLTILILLTRGHMGTFFSQLKDGDFSKPDPTALEKLQTGETPIPVE